MNLKLRIVTKKSEPQSFFFLLKNKILISQRLLKREHRIKARKQNDEENRMSYSRITVPPTKWNTKIVCTLGPASSSEERLEELIRAGMDVCRLNFSHGEHATHKQTFDLIRKLSSKYNEQVAILCDIQGPKIRTGLMENPFELRHGDVVRVTPDRITGTKERFQITYETLLEDLHIDDVIFINDGIVKLVVTEKDLPNKDLICFVEAAGSVSNHKGCNMPSGKLSANIVTPKDAADLKFIAALDPEYVAASFVGDAEDVRKVRARLAECGNTSIKIIAKIERPVALENIDAIIQEADAIMVARGDLGVEIEAWDVPTWQKEMVKRANRESIPVIVATQMMESMCQNSRPTRAEASDVYNAVLDGADAVMLSGESSVGLYPVESVKIMDNIVRVAQLHMPKRDPNDYDSSSQAVTETVCHAAYTISTEFRDIDYKGKIIVTTVSGRTARLISKYRPALPILAFSCNLRAVRELALVWGVRAHHMPEMHDLHLEDRAIMAIDVACRIGYVDASDTKVCVLSCSKYQGAGYFTGVYDISKLTKLKLTKQKYLAK
jgi:pyruvate kinase